MESQNNRLLIKIALKLGLDITQTCLSLLTQCGIRKLKMVLVALKGCHLEHLLEASKMGIVPTLLLSLANPLFLQ